MGKWKCQHAVKRIMRQHAMDMRRGDRMQFQQPHLKKVNIHLFPADMRIQLNG